MQVFLAQSFNEAGEIILSAEESKHCIKVLRHKVGDLIYVIDGVGNSYSAEIVEGNPQRCVARVHNKQKIEFHKPYYLHIAISPTKNADRIEWLIEKGTELGVDEFSFVICKRTEKTGIKTDRFKKIAESAVKQSMQGIIPKLNEAIKFSDFIKHKDGPNLHKYIAHCMDSKKTALKDVLQQKNVLTLIGPEGDFTEDEIALAQLNGFEALSLGKTRLRTETAGLIMAAGMKSVS